MACGQNYRAHECALLSGMSGVDADHAVALQYEAGHEGLKVDLSTAVDNSIADVLNNAR